jgi:histidinol-phosphatase (PHP family)
MIADGHVHTPFCPHGSKDSFDDYINKAIQLGIQEITFTEHAPLPITFSDPTPTKDSAMSLADLEDYFTILTSLQNNYKNDIKINRGLEIDFIIGYENETEEFLNTYGTSLDDSILSVHFLKYQDNYYCVDYSADSFGNMVKIFGSIDSIYEAYYQTVLHSVHSDLGPFKPRRIGHITLVNKFQKKFPATKDYGQEITTIIKEMAARHLQLDYNGAGINKPLCLEPYPPHSIMNLVKQEKLKIIYGSDAHQASDLGQGFLSLDKSAILSSPTSL